LSLGEEIYNTWSGRQPLEVEGRLTVSRLYLLEVGRGKVR